MTLRSATEDFVHTTLAAIPGVLGKLRYVSSLRVNGGRYAHWGLGKLHGDQKAQEAIAENHRQLLEQVIAMPIRNLWNEVESFKNAEDPWCGVSALSEHSLLPPESDELLARHFELIRHCLVALETCAAR